MVEYESKAGRGEQAPALWTWRSLREWIAYKHGNTYTHHELRQMEIKWKKICSAAGWSVKGQ